MISTHPAFLATLVPLLALAQTRAVHADSRVTLEYEAPGGCPTQAEFVGAVTARGSRFDGNEASARVRNMAVSIRQSAGGFEGSLRVEASAGDSAVREVHADGCAEVANGLAIVAAIALSGTAEQPATPVAASPAPSQGSPPGAKPAPPPPPPSPRAPETKPRLTGSSFKLEREIQVEAGTLRFDRLHAIDLSAGVDYGLLPHLVMPRYELSSSVTNFVTVPETSGGERKAYLVGPILEVKWTIYGPGSTRNKGFETKVFGFDAGVRSCSAFRYDSLAFSLLACGEFSIGWLNLETQDTQGGAAPTKKETGFGSAGLILNARYALNSQFYVGLKVGGRMQLGGLTAERPDGSRIFEPQLFGAFGQAGLGLQF